MTSQLILLRVTAFTFENNIMGKGRREEGEGEPGEGRKLTSSTESLSHFVSVEVSALVSIKLQENVLYTYNKNPGTISQRTI